MGKFPIVILFILFLNGISSKFVARVLKASLESPHNTYVALAHDNRDSIYILRGGNMPESLKILVFSISEETIQTYDKTLPLPLNVRCDATYDPIQDSIWLAGALDYNSNLFHVVKIPLGTPEAPSIITEINFPSRGSGQTFWNPISGHLFLMNDMSGPTLRYNPQDGSIINATSRHENNRQTTIVWNKDGSNAFVFGGAWSSWMTRDIVMFRPSLLENRDGYKPLDVELSDRTESSQSVSDGKYAYIFGGYDFPLTKLDRFNMATHELETFPLEGMPYNHTTGSAAIYISQKNTIYIFGKYGQQVVPVIAINLDGTQN